jgi:hypothetical protein
MGRNADYFSLGFDDRGMLLVVYHPDDGQAVAAVSFLGMIGAFTGINEKGVAFGNMLVYNAAGPERQDGGLPIALLQRLAAQKAATARAMAADLQTQRHVIPMNVMVGDAHEALVVELGLSGSAVRGSPDGLLAASNHFRTPLLYAQEVSCPRYKSLMEDGRAAQGAMSVEQMKAALYRARVEKLNLQAVVFEPAAMRMHVAVNRVPASAGPYVEVDLQRLFAAAPDPGLAPSAGLTP